MSDWAERILIAIQTDDEFPNHIDDALRGACIEEGLERVAVSAAATLFAQRAGIELSEGCVSESPLEEAMYWALILEGLRQADTLKVRIGTRENVYGRGEVVPTVVTIDQQVEIGDYRADFLITVRERQNFEEFSEARAIVECDGHDFHERTKEQARRDKSRDRTLQGLGFDVLRFAGSEVWADPLRCAREAIAHVEALAFKQLSQGGE